MNDYIRKIKQLAASADRADLEREAYERIIVPQMRNTSEADVDDLDYVPVDTPTRRGRLMPGSIYVFAYKADAEPTIELGGRKVRFTDTYPMLLVTGATRTTVRGINLNMCNMALRSIILNLVHDLDAEFFDGGFARQAATSANMFSAQVMRFFSQPDIEAKVGKYLDSVARLDTYSVIFRNYKVANIREMREVSPSEWAYIPFLSYGEHTKAGELQAIYRLSGMDRLKLV